MVGALEPEDEEGEPGIWSRREGAEWAAGSLPKLADNQEVLGLLEASSYSRIAGVYQR